MYKHCLNFTKKGSIPKRYQVALAGWVSRGVSSLCQVLLISITLGYLGVDLYAIFAILLGLQSWFALTDYGLGSGLQNYVSEARAKNADLLPILSNTAIIIYALLITTITAFLWVAPYLQHILLRRLNTTLINSQYYILSVVGVVLIATNLFGVGYRVFFGNHKGYLVYLYQGIGYVWGICNVWLIKYFNSTLTSRSLVLILIGWLLPNLLFSLLSFIQNFPFRKVLHYFDLKLIKTILRRSFNFWILAITATLAVLSDYLVISQTLPARDIVLYNVLAKSFNLIFFSYSAILSGLWPEMAELFVKKQWPKANGLLNKHILLGIALIAICTVVFLFARNLIISILAPQAALVAPALPIILFGIYYLIRVWVDSYAVALQSQNSLKIFWITSLIQAILSVSGMYLLSLYLGINGVVLGLTLALMVTAAWLLPVAYYKRRTLLIING